jgi:hypothetical protein
VEFQRRSTVKKRFYGKEVVFIVCCIFLFSALAFAQGKDIQSKGKVMQLDFAKKTVIVNEKTFVWDANTLFYDEKGSPIPIIADRLTKGTRVSIEATWIKKKPLEIKKLSLLPKK